MALFQSFLQGYQAGEEMKKTRQRSAALLGASQAYQAGDYDKAQQPLLEAGLLDEANFYGQMSDRKKKSELAKTTGPMLQNRDYGGAANAAFGAGDLDMGVKLQEMATNWTAQQKQEFGESMQKLGSIAGSLFSVPAEQRGQAALAQIKGTPYESPQIVQAIEQAAADGRITDDELEAFQTQVMTAAEQVAGKRWQMQFDQNRQIADRNFRLAASKPAAGVSKQQEIFSTKRLGEATESADMARTLSSFASRFRSLNEDTDTGGMMRAPVVGGLVQGWRGMTEKNIQEMQGITAKIGPMLRQAGSGAMSDKDLAFFMQAVPNVVNDKDVNGNMADALDEAAKNATGHEAFLNAYYLDQGTVVGAEPMWKEYLDANPIFTDDGTINTQRPQWESYFGLAPGPAERSGFRGARGQGAPRGGGSDPLGIR